MTKEFKAEHNIRGCRYAITLTKEVKGMPGFAPEYYNAVVGDVVVKFLDRLDRNDGSEPYFQCFKSPPILLPEDIEEILSLMKRGFVESDFEQ